MKVLFYPMSNDFQKKKTKKSAAFWEVPPDFWYEQCVDYDYGALVQ
jgi:hypothetical protein